VDAGCRVDDEQPVFPSTSNSRMPQSTIGMPFNGNSFDKPQVIKTGLSTVSKECMPLTDDSFKTKLFFCSYGLQASHE
jgi:hypothetical protein